MSISTKKESDIKDIPSNTGNSEEPKIPQDQTSLIEPSTERGTHLNELTRTEIFHNSASAIRLNSSYNNLRPNPFFPQSQLSIDEEDSADMNPEDNIFEGDDYDYYNYNELLIPNYNRQFAQLSFDGITNWINSILNFEKNDIINEKDSMKNQIKIYEDLKNNFNKQKTQKKDELNNLFLSGKYEIDFDKNKNKDKIINIKDIKEEKEKIIQIELSNGEIIKIKSSILKKYPNSVLSAFINPENKYPKRNGNIFIDRDSKIFKYLLYYLENEKLPNFKNISEEKKFFSEINFWKVPLKQKSKISLKFNPIYSPYFFTLDKKCQTLVKSNFNKGIILLNKKLNALTPYIEFYVYLNFPNREKKILLALVDENKIEKVDLNKTFDNGIPFVFYWDLFGEKIVKSMNNNFNLSFNKEYKTVELNKFCKCYKDNYEIKFGLYYNQQEHSIELFRDDVKLNIIIQNIDPGLTPAFEITNDNCKIKLSSKNNYQNKMFL